MGGKWRWTHFWKSLFLIFHSRHFLDFLPKFIKNHQNCRGFWRIWDFGAWTNGQVNRVLHQRPKTTRTSPRKNCDRRPFRWESGGLSVDSGGKYHEDVDLMGYAWGNGVDNMWQNGTYMYIYICIYIYIYLWFSTMQHPPLPIRVQIRNKRQSLYVARHYGSGSLERVVAGINTLQP